MAILGETQEQFRKEWGGRVFRAQVTGTVGNLVTIQRTGEDSPDDQSYPRLASYSAPVGQDECIVLQVGDGLIVLGKVVR